VAGVATGADPVASGLWSARTVRMAALPAATSVLDWVDGVTLIGDGLGLPLHCGAVRCPVRSRVFLGALVPRVH
jgi:hypothetical protein